MAEIYNGDYGPNSLLDGSSSHDNSNKLADISAFPVRSGLSSQYVARHSSHDIPMPTTIAELYSRDWSGIEFSRSLLNTGDTLVFIKHPGGKAVYDPSGYHLKNEKHIVHSDKLLATGSSKFKKLLQDDWKQHLMRKRNGYLNKEALPTGIKFVLDLTPPDEGDEAVDLISELSCSPGIRNWYTSQRRCGVHESLVGGRDEVSKLKTPLSPSEETQTPSSYQGDCDEANAKTIEAVPDDKTKGHSTDIKPPTKTVEGGSASSPDDKTKIKVNTGNYVRDTVLERVLERSRKEVQHHQEENLQFDPNGQDTVLEVEEVEEYSPLRHRAAIERLLQIIEGKSPRLDSAPKVWTLVGIAKYFDCRKVVVDRVMSWMLSEPNTQFIETLPEASFMIGKSLQSPVIARPAFAILVSEEALNIAFRMCTKSDVVGASLQPSQIKGRTSRFCRIVEHIDEDSLAAIQAAASDFQTRIQQIVDQLVDVNMDWMHMLPEFTKLTDFKQSCLKMPFTNKIDDLMASLKKYVRAQILTVFAQPLSLNESTIAAKHRRAENYFYEWNGDFSRDIFECMSDGEKVLTRFFWLMLRQIHWSFLNHGNTLFHKNGPLSDSKRQKIIKDYRVLNVTMATIISQREQANEIILEEIKWLGYNKGKIPAECFEEEVDEKDAPGLPIDFWNYEDPFVIREKKDQYRGQSIKSPKREDSNRSEVSDAFSNHQHFNRLSFQEKMTKIQFSGAISSLKSSIAAANTNTTPAQGFLAMGSQDTSQPSTSGHDPFSFTFTPKFPLKTPQIPIDHKIPTTSPLFSLTNFLDQVHVHLASLCAEMLSEHEVDFRYITDTVLCLTDNEYKYLPLWAGGDDDGSGGVFGPLAPPTDMGPNGPGPSYHTGYSSTSRASTEIWDGERFGGSVDTSIQVEDGWRDHVDRREVVSFGSESDFDRSSVAFTEDSETYSQFGGNSSIADKGKGKAKEIISSAASTASIAPSTTSGLTEYVVEATEDEGEYTEVGDDTEVNTDNDSDAYNLSDDDDFMNISDDEGWVDDDGLI
ncbi:hypothetical protein B0O99DRAFT_178743 [Bisporella sp. PMI_857]|nr:hypothetical protein B0O99DRAFT_178743 [Bisporella sp. PMI_857]